MPLMQFGMHSATHCKPRLSTHPTKRCVQYSTGELSQHIGNPPPFTRLNVDDDLVCCCSIATWHAQHEHVTTPAPRSSSNTSTMAWHTRESTKKRTTTMDIAKLTHVHMHAEESDVMQGSVVCHADSAQHARPFCTCCACCDMLVQDGMRHVSKVLFVVTATNSTASVTNECAKLGWWVDLQLHHR